jgi:NTE family protein
MPVLKKQQAVSTEIENTAATWTWLKKYLPFTDNNQKIPARPSYSMFNVLSTCYDYTQDRLTEMLIQFYPPDLLVEIPRNACAVFEFYRAAELIENGRDAYKKAKEQTETVK